MSRMRLQTGKRAGESVGLRRADWRFLLPPPAGGYFDHLVLLGGPAGLAEQLTAAKVAQRVTSHLPAEGDADAVILLYDNPTTLEEAVAYLRPGGVFYQEVDRRSSRKAVGPSRAQGRLRAAGLTPTGLYWVAPNFADPKRYLPLEVPGVLSWYLSTIYVAGTPLHRLAEWGVRLLTGGRSQAFAPFAPCYALTATAGLVEPAAPSILAHPDLPAWLQRPDLRPVLLTSGQDDGSRVVVLPFAPDSRQPLAALKLTRLARFNALTESEHHTLRQLHQRLTPELRRTIPEPHGLLRLTGLTVALENYIQGYSLWTSTGRWTASVSDKIDDLHQATNWLVAFHCQTEVERLCWQPADVERWIDRPLVAYEAAFGLTPAERTHFTAARAYACALVGATLPLVWRHFDFGPWNLYRQQDSFTVIDWEPYTDWQRPRTGPPLCDLLYFVTYWTFMVRRHYGEQAELNGFRDLHLRPPARDKFGQATQAALTTYLAELGLDTRFRPLLLLYTWVDRALDRLDRQRLLGTLTANPRTDNRYLQYVAVLAEGSTVLFANP